ncbi:MAG: glycosyltransferase family 2 protein, partial [Planctomycetota bacterium]
MPDETTTDAADADGDLPRVLQIAQAPAVADAPTAAPDELLARLRDAERAIRDCLADFDAASEQPAETGQVELSVVMPCLNEADTLATCIEKAQRAMDEAGIAGEVVVADNGSTDGSIEIAHRHGARVVPVAEKGYGAALMGGIEASAGRYVIMGDADDSYDFLEIPKFVAKLRAGHALVQGCRLPWGGGAIKPG